MNYAKNDDDDFCDCTGGSSGRAFKSNTSGKPKPCYLCGELVDQAEPVRFTIVVQDNRNEHIFAVRHPECDPSVTRFPISRQ